MGKHQKETRKTIKNCIFDRLKLLNAMAVELVMPKMGESIMEATILKWLKKEGDTVALDEPILEIATDKVDSEVPSPVEGTISSIMFQEGDTVEVGKVIAMIGTDGEAVVSPSPAVEEKAPEPKRETTPAAVMEAAASAPVAVTNATPDTTSNGSKSRFYSPLVMNIARSENISMNELEAIPGSGKNERVTKKDIMAYLKNRQNGTHSIQPATTTPKSSQATATPTVSTSGNVEIVEMDRMRQLIADHMVMSKQTSPHVTSFVEADVTNMVLWRNKHKGEFQKREGEKLTFTPLFVELVVQAIKEFPLVNASVDGKNMVIKKDINIGMATALPSGNLIVPVIKNADQKNLIGLAKEVNGLATRARDNKLKPEEIEGGTFTLTNVGTFGNLMGTPIINQPQVAILATGAIKKKPVVIETPAGDSIAIRHMMYLSLSYDHRIVDGALGGSFLRKIADNFEAFDINKTI